MPFASSLELPVRHNEDKLNAELARDVPWPVDSRNIDDPHVKANLLFQAHFSRCRLPISDYITDTKSVLDNAIRIIQVPPLPSSKRHLCPSTPGGGVGACFN